MNYLLTIDSSNATNTGDVTISFSPPIDTRGLQYNLGMCRLDMSYSWYNITSLNNTFKYNNGSADRTLTISPGCYSFQNLVSEIHDLMILEGDVTVVSSVNTFDINLSLDLSNGYTSLILTNSYTVDFTGLGIRSIFGFNSAVYNTSTVSPNKSDITNRISTVLVHCDLTAGHSYKNSNSNDVIYSFKVNAQENETFSIEPSYVRFLPINTRSSVNSLRVYMTDQSGNVLNLQGYPFTCELMLEPILNY